MTGTSPLRGRSETLIPGTHAALAAGMDAYHAANLREALKLVPDTGDWHGSLRIVCDMVLARDGRLNPNQTAEQMGYAALQLAHKEIGNL